MNDRTPTVREAGEEVIRERFLRLFPAREGVLVSSAEDAGLLELPGGRWIWTEDLLVEDVHFRLRWADPLLLGRKALGVSLSDCAAMGADPFAVLISLALPGDLPLEFLDRLALGLREEAARWEVGLAGGDTNASPGPLVLGTSVLGRVIGEPFLANRARPGDVLAVTGPLGGAALGLFCLERGLDLPAAREAVQRQLCPPVRLAEARELARSGLRVACRDASDGLVPAARALASASGVAVEIEEASLPLVPGLAEAARELGLDPFLLALWGGEDYELVVSLPRLPDRPLLLPLGRVVEGEGVFLLRDGKRIPLTGEGYDSVRGGGGWPWKSA